MQRKDGACHRHGLRVTGGDYVNTMRGNQPPSNGVLDITDVKPRSMTLDEAEVAMGLPAGFTKHSRLNERDRWSLLGKSIDVHALVYLIRPLVCLFVESAKNSGALGNDPTPQTRLVIDPRGRRTYCPGMPK